VSDLSPHFDWVATKQELLGKFAFQSVLSHHSEFVDIQVRQTLKGHRKSHLSHIVGYETVDHHWEMVVAGEGRKKVWSMFNNNRLQGKTEDNY